MLSDALLVIDLQFGVCNEDGKIFDYENIIARTNDRIQKYYETDKVVIFVRHNDPGLIKDSADWHVVDELNTSRGLFVDKTHANAFYHTNLKELLDEHDVESIEICGAQTEYCVDGTVKFGHGLGYSLYMQRGMTTTYDNEMMTAEQTVKFFEGLWDRRYVEFF